jgi:TrmH family RNA methyltransferase
MINKQQIKLIRSLQQKKYRDENNLFVVEGLKSVNETIDTLPHLLKTIFVSEESKTINNLNPLPNTCKLIEVPGEEFPKLSSLKTPQGILALVNKPSLKLPEFITLKDLIIVLDRIRDPGNLGTIIRLADWFGIKNIICSEDTVDCYNPKVIQASMGGILRVDIHYTNLSSFIKGLKIATGYKVYGTSLNGNNLYHDKLDQPAVIIFGNESLGISEELTNLIDQNLLIPNYNLSKETSESLNVSIASAIVCAEFRRQTLANHSK